MRFGDRPLLVGERLGGKAWVWAARGRERPRPGPIARPFRPRDRVAFGVSSDAGDGPCRWTTIATMP
jgi:hypothetical protein